MGRVVSAPRDRAGMGRKRGVSEGPGDLPIPVKLDALDDPARRSLKAPAAIVGRADHHAQPSCFRAHAAFQILYIFSTRSSPFMNSTKT